MRFLMRRQPFSQLDPGSVRIDDERDLQSAQLGNLAIRHVERDSVGRQFLAERVQIFHFKPDVIERAAFGGRGRILIVMGLFGAALLYGDGIGDVPVAWGEAGLPSRAASYVRHAVAAGRR